MERSRTPRPDSTRAWSGSAAISPQTETGTPCALRRSHDAVRSCAARPGAAAGRGATPAGPPIHGEQILDEVVGAHAEEVDVGGEEIGGQGRARDLEGDSHRHVLRERRRPRSADPGALSSTRASADAEVARSGHEREHDAQRPVDGGPQAGRGAASGTAPASRRRRRRPAPPGRGSGWWARPAEVLAPDVPGAHGDRVRPHLSSSVAVDLDLLLLRRPRARAAEQVLGAEEADALRAVLSARSPPPPGTPRSPAGGPATPSRVTRGQRRGSPAAASSRGSRSWAARKPSRTGSEGSTTTSPRVPSTTTRAPGGHRRVASCSPTTAGMPSERARIDV